MPAGVENVTIDLEILTAWIQLLKINMVKR